MKPRSAKRFAHRRAAGAQADRKEARRPAGRQIAQTCPLALRLPGERSSETQRGAAMRNSRSIGHAVGHNRTPGRTSFRVSLGVTSNGVLPDGPPAVRAGPLVAEKAPRTLRQSAAAAVTATWPEILRA